MLLVIRQPCSQWLHNAWLYPCIFLCKLLYITEKLWTRKHPAKNELKKSLRNYKWNHKARPLTKIWVIPFIKEQLFSNPLHDDIPWMYWACTTHQCGNNRICSKHISFASQLSNNRVISCCYTMECSTIRLQNFWILCRDSIIHFVVKFHSTSIVPR